jgi:hypothetical protein
VVRTRGVVECLLQVRQVERAGDGVAQGHADESARVVSQAGNRLGGDRPGGVDEVRLALPVGGVVQADRFPVPERRERVVDARSPAGRVTTP